MAEVFVWLHNLGLKTVYKYLRILSTECFPDHCCACSCDWAGSHWSKQTVSLQTGGGGHQERKWVRPAIMLRAQRTFQKGHAFQKGQISRIFKVVAGSKKKELASRAVWSPLLLVATGKRTWIHTYLLYNVGDLKVAVASMARQQSQRASLTF